uniref:Protein-tyrosine-phosphatase n=1 Tax=Callorhinchus milii TaxID=7868 RepID=A0A4W3GVD8_CALMI
PSHPAEVCLVLFLKTLRSAVPISLALIESGMKYEDAIQFIRQKRQGIINRKQLSYLEKYWPKMDPLKDREPVESGKSGGDGVTEFGAGEDTGCRVLDYLEPVEGGVGKADKQEVMKA